MKTLTVIASLVLVSFISSCGGEEKSKSETGTQEEPKSMVADPEAYDPKRGEGKYTAESLALTDKLDEAQAKVGEEVSNVKCTSCHKMSDEKLVGPGWKDVTKRRTGEWIMNFITNPDPMLDKDPEAQAMLELCLVRMPNQSLTDSDARAILEYMRKNDGVK
ncbi:MAG: c-type cytochrome [Bacteroidota bacterium]|jgi:cytochrome c551/c552|nr:c-type cytochrome [Bacteroidota bacterium]